KLVPGDVTRMLIEQDDWPVFLLDPARTPLDARFFTRQCMPARLGSPIDVRSCIQWAVQDIQDPAVAEAHPFQLACTRSTPLSRREEQLMRGEVAHHSQRRVGLLEESEHQTDRFLDGFIRI